MLLFKSTVAQPVVLQVFVCFYPEILSSEYTIPITPLAIINNKP